MSQTVEQQALSVSHQTEQEAQYLRCHTDAQPEHLREQWKRQVSQAATYKAEIHALHTELQNGQEKSELRATCLPNAQAPPTHEEEPSTASCRSTVHPDTPRGVPLGHAPCFGHPPEILDQLQLRRSILGYGDCWDQGPRAHRQVQLHAVISIHHHLLNVHKDMVRQEEEAASLRSRRFQLSRRRTTSTRSSKRRPSRTRSGRRRPTKRRTTPGEFYWRGPPPPPPPPPSSGTTPQRTPAPGAPGGSPRRAGRGFGQRPIHEPL